jgi:hypothetical protein
VNKNSGHFLAAAFKSIAKNSMHIWTENLERNPRYSPAFCLYRNLNGIIEPPTRGRIDICGPFTTDQKKEIPMNAKQIMMGAAAIGCIVTMTMSGVSAQEQDSVSGRVNARVGNHMEASGQFNGTARQGGNRFVNGRQAREVGRERQGVAEGRNFGAERRLATDNGYSRRWRGDGREFNRVAVEHDGAAWRDDRLAYRVAEPPVVVDAGVATGGYAWTPGYAYSGYAPGPLYAYAPGYNVAPYDYGYAPGVTVGIGPIGIGVGPYWD